jgi:hypothetical protein
MNVEAGKEYRVKFPFCMAHWEDFSSGELEAKECWRPGVKSIPVYDDFEDVAEAEGEMVLTVVDIHKPGRFPERVFYTRRWVDPDGNEFGKNKLHITTTPTFKRRAAGYYHEYRVL